jgi:predicted lipase
MNKAISQSDVLVYRIEVQGHLDRTWSESLGMLVATVAGDPPASSLTGEADQAGLHGVLGKIYSIGLAIISVTIVDSNRPTEY